MLLSALESVTSSPDFWIGLSTGLLLWAVWALIDRQYRIMHHTHDRIYPPPKLWPWSKE